MPRVETDPDMSVSVGGQDNEDGTESGVITIEYSHLSRELTGKLIDGINIVADEVTGQWV